MRIAFIAIGAAALLMVVACGASDNEKLGGPWVIEHVSPWNPDGRHAKYLARGDRWRLRRVSGRVFDARYVEPDCVIYSGYDHGLYAVCGDRQPIYIATLGDDFADLRPDVILVGTREYPVADLTQAALRIEQERLGGSWIAQREAFPDESDADAPRFELFHENPYETRRVGIPVLAHRYLDDECLLYVYPGVMRILVDPNGELKGDFPVAAACGNRYEVFLGAVDHPSDILIGHEIPIGGEKKALSELKQRALAARER